ncbi:52 kDa repressor of the inhibitor of the protein kinase-like [Acropora muricata]|uniref:52 kDa repressor of the inhibitor of the protein kinase-like n=1 Tax=Acropora muricata TaxID=159855 RepID=UPI0034E4EDF9
MVRGDPVCRKEDCSQYDIGLVFKEISAYSDQDKLKFIENVWKPGEHFDFPVSVECSNSKRHFVWGWLKRFPWLAYSKFLDGAFCLPCVLFGVQCGRNSNKLDKLYKTPLTLWTSAMSRFTKHASGKCEMHTFSVLAMDNFVRNMTRESVPIDQQINNLLQQQITRNREILKSLFKTIIFCGRNNIALRGPRDDDPQNASLSGNFQALLEFRIDSGDQTLQHHLRTAPRNATYISKTIQNEMITTVGAVIVNNLSQEIRDSKYFSIMSDEAADISNKENLSVVIRFLDSTKTVREEFVGFYLCEDGTTGAAIKDLILGAVVDLGLSMDDCRGQCYDGAGNMSGRLNGASSLIRAEHDKTIYVHCMNHRLNLCIADTCQLPLVRNMMDVVRKLSEFFDNSPKRQQHLINKIRLLMPAANHFVLVNVCRTRWIERIDGMDRIVELLHPVVATLEDISVNRNGPNDGSNWNQNSRNDAQALINAITFPFIITVVIVRHILDLTRPLTLRLQKKAMDLLKAKEEIVLLKAALRGMQTDLNTRHHALYEEAVTLARRVSVEPSMPRIIQRQVYRNNAPAPTPEDYYRINLTTDFLNHALMQLDNRFEDDVFVCYKGFSVIASILLATDPIWKDNVREFCDHYRQDIPNQAGLPAELLLWERMWKEKRDRMEDIPDSIGATLEQIDKDAYVNIYTMLQILITIPFSSASCERSISALRNLKTYLRNTMVQDRLNGLALMHAHREMELDLEKIVDLFANLHPRRMRMENILNE